MSLTADNYAAQPAWSRSTVERVTAAGFFLKVQAAHVLKFSLCIGLFKPFVKFMEKDFSKIIKKRLHMNGNSI